MNIRSFSILFTFFAFLTFFSGAVSAQTSWLDRPLRNWNTTSTVPRAPQMTIDREMQQRCTTSTRRPETGAERSLTQRGWLLFGASQTYGAITVLNALADFDGMCRPNQYNAFVFSGARFIGTLSPDHMNSRMDASLQRATLWNDETVTAEFSRYTSNDPLCCPSQTSSVVYDLPKTATGRISATEVTTGAVCVTTPQAQENMVSGTVTYRNRAALPAGAVITVKLVDVSRADSSGIVVAEQQIEANGRQVPIPFAIEYKPTQINERNRYNVRAEIRAGGRLVYISDVAYPVLTQGNANEVEILVVPVRGNQDPGNANRRIRGTITYNTREALPANSEVRVRLIEMNATNEQTEANIIAETGFDTGNRQVPIDFELPYAQSSVQRGRTYALEAEIRTNNDITHKTESPHELRVTGVNIDNVRLTLVQAETAVTGKSISLSKFGTGTLRIGDQASRFLIRGNASVETDGDAEVAVSALTGTITFTGKVIEFTDDVIRLRVTNSGNADASGEIEIRYSGRTLRSMIGRDLVLDGQETTLNF